MDTGSDDCLMFPAHPEYCDWLLLCKSISASLSIIGCLFTIFIIWLFHKYTEFTQRMIIHLSVATLLQAISYLLVDFVSEATLLCTIQGALMQFVAWVILLWILAIIINLLSQVIRGKRLGKYEIQLSLFCWFVPVLIAALPFVDDAYAPAGAWCWLKNTWGWRFGSWYIWSLCSFVFIFVSIVVITYKLRQHEKSVVGTFDSEYAMRHKLIKEAVRTLRVYPIAYFLVILFPTINRIQNILHGSQGHDAYVFELVLLHSLTDPLDGAVITLAFVMDRRTRRVLKFKKIKEAWKKKFENKAQIHELKLKSKLSCSDFVIAARLSISSMGETDSPGDKEQKKRDKSEPAMETIPEVENSFQVVIKKKRDTRRRVSITFENNKDTLFTVQSKYESLREDSEKRHEAKQEDQLSNAIVTVSECDNSGFCLQESSG